jgi:tetratricopeptide (TPR) repeat protein
MVSGAYGELQSMLEESLAIFQALGYRSRIAYSMLALSQLAEVQWQLKRAEHLARESLTIHREADHQHMIEPTLRALAWILYLRGKNAEAHSVLEEALEICNELGMGQQRTSQANAWLGLVQLQLGQYQKARAQAELSLAIAREKDVSPRVADTLEILGCVALAEGAYAEAQQLLQESTTLFRATGRQEMLSDALALLGVASCGLGQTHQAKVHLCEAVAIATDIQATEPLTFALPAVALLFADRGEHARAVELYTLAFRLPSVANSRWFEDVFGRHIAAAAADLPPDVVAEAQERGRERDLWATAQELLDELKA